MPVIDETKQTLELKAFRRELLEKIEALIKRVAALEEKGGKK